MKRFVWPLLLAGLFSAVGCGESVPPATQMTPELESQIKTQDAAVDAAESANR